MRAEIVHVTDHALLRWRQRAAVHANEGVHEVIKVVKQARVLKKKELLPYPMPRLRHSVYAVKDEILFVLESLSITEYNLVTVITGDMPYRVNPKKKKRKIPPMVEKHQKKEILEFPVPKKVSAVASKMYQRPPIILSVAEKTMVNEAVMEVAVKLGLVVNL